MKSDHVCGKDCWKHSSGFEIHLGPRDVPLAGFTAQESAVFWRAWDAWRRYDRSGSTGFKHGAGYMTEDDKRRRNEARIAYEKAQREWEQLKRIGRFA